jgi:predicted DNA-binding transcriptional regulator YafY
MSRRKTERILGLVVCLLSAGSYLTASQIKDAVPGYPESFDAFKRMFEQDKDDLRELGIPLETRPGSTASEEPGYRIRRQAYMLPEIRLEPDEAAVVGLAARVWRGAELAGAAAGALLKLRAAGIEAEETTQPGIEPRLQTGEAAFGPLWEAVRDRRPVSFGYRAAGQVSAQQRHLEPWGLVNRRGRWYVAGLETDRGRMRVFRLSRIDGPVTFSGPAGAFAVPDGIDVRELVREWDPTPQARRTAVLQVRQGAGYGLRRGASAVMPDQERPGWDLVEVPFSDVGWHSEHLASFGANVVALEPADLREAVIARLKGAFVSHASAARRHGLTEVDERPSPAAGSTGSLSDVGQALREDAHRAEDAGPAANVSLDSGPPRTGPGTAGTIPEPTHSASTAGERALSPQRFLVATMPTRVPLSALLSLQVRVSTDHVGGSALLEGLQIGPGGAQVTVVVQAPYELSPQTALEQVISVPAVGNSQPVRFAFLARGLGAQRVIITAWAGGTFLAELALEVSVEQSGPYLDGPPRKTPVGPVKAEPGEVTLQVRFDGQRYSFQLLSQAYLFEPVIPEALTTQPSQAVERTIATLRAIALGTSGYSDGNARTWMERAGLGLWNDMVPELIKEQFWLLRGNITAFSIAAADDIIPWELLYPMTEDHDEGFLVEQFPVVRRVYGQRRLRTFTVGETRYVVPSGAPRNAVSEIATIRRVLGEAESRADAIDRLDVLLDLIESGDCGLLHFACHNSFTADGEGSVISMDGGAFVPTLLTKAVTKRTLDQWHPLVFINACRSAGSTPEYTRIMGWAQRFMAAGAGAFAGTLWAVRSESAATFAEAFYAALRAGIPLGEASRQARVETDRDHDDPTWLAYTVYGDPAARAVMVNVS